jgi:hypothetical protein
MLTIYLLLAHGVIYLGLSVYYFKLNKKVKARDNIIYTLLLVLVTVLCISRAHVVTTVLLTLCVLAMYCTSAGMLILKPMSNLYKIVLKNPVQTQSSIYNRDIVEFALRGTGYLLLLLSIN